MTSPASRGPVDPRLLRYARAARGFFAISAAITLAQTAVIIAFAWLLTNALVGAISGESVASLLPLLGGAAALLIARGLLLVAAEVTSARGAARASQQLRARLVSAIATLGPAWVSRRNTASLAVTAGHGLEALDAYFGRYLPQLVATVITTPLVTLTIFLADWVSGVIVVVTLPLIPIFMVLIGLATRSVQRKQFDTLRTLAARFADTVGGLGTLKLFGRHHRAAETIDTVTRAYKRETMTVLRVSFISGFALEFLASLSVALIAVTIGLRLLDGDLTLLIGLFVLLLAPEAYLPIRQVGVQFHAAAEGVAATEEIFEALTAAEGMAVTSGASVYRQSDPTIDATGLAVRRGEHTLPPVDLSVGPGELVLVQGPSGSGKSSVVAAILGFAEHDGEVRVGGEAAPEARRAAIAWAGQQHGLVSGTVAENVALGDPEPDSERVADALRRAQASSLDPGTVVGVAGSGLSGGQAQRVSIARAFYRLDPDRALILDEPSSALDRDTEAALWRELRTTANGGTPILLISHRESAREIADRVVRVEATVTR